MTGIYSNILESTMDTYANIINNNMSTVMKTLTLVSMFLMVPTLVASLFGMNLLNGMETRPWGFVFALVLSIILTLVFWWYARRKSWI
jgi:magnesium transporter